MLSIFPSFLHVRIRRMLRQKIGKGTKIKIGTLILSRKLEIGVNTRIGPLTLIISNELKIGNHVIIKPLVLINTWKVEIANYVHFAPLCVVNSEFTTNSSLKIGDHSRVFPLCWLDTGEGIKIGKQVGIGGHTLMFTHGVWSNYIDGGPVSFGPIELKDNVWLPWRVFILPNVTIGENVIVGANSLINKSVEANTLVGGSPAKVLKKIDFTTNFTQKKERFIEILKNFSNYIQFKHDLKSKLQGNRLVFNDLCLIVNELDKAKKGDLLINLRDDFEKLDDLVEKGVSVLDYPKLTIHLHGKEKAVVKEFISYLRRFGVRLYIK